MLIANSFSTYMPRFCSVSDNPSITSAPSTSTNQESVKSINALQGHIKNFSTTLPSKMLKEYVQGIWNRLAVHEQDIPVKNAHDISLSSSSSTPSIESIELLADTDALAPSNGNMVVDSLDGPVTKNEIQSFINYIKTLKPQATTVNNEWTQGRSGENLKAMALVYEIAPQKEILDKMVLFCDTLLSVRNDMKGKRVIWTGRVDPVWPNQPNEKPIQTGGEQGDPVGHLAACARQILQTRAIHSSVVPDGDPYQFGKTYLQRAKRYLIEADKTVDQHILRSLVTLRDGNHMYFSKASLYKSGLPVPWNQQMMFIYGFMNLAQAHALLKDAPSRVKFYDQIVKSNADWFFKNGVSSYTDKARLPAYDWGYTMPDKTGEDSSHGSLDVAGLYRMYKSGRYGINAQQLAPIANIVTDVIPLGKGSYAGRLNGTSSGGGNSAPTNRLRSGFLFTALFKPKAYKQMMANAGIQSGGNTNRIDVYSRFLWVKHQRSQPKGSAAQVK